MTTSSAVLGTLVDFFFKRDYRLMATSDISRTIISQEVFCFAFKLLSVDPALPVKLEVLTSLERVPSTPI